MADSEGTETSRMLWAGRMEIVVIVWRIKESACALGDAPSLLRKRRWNHGIARELVRHMFTCQAQHIEGFA